MRSSFRVLLLEDDYDQAELVYELLQLDGPFEVDLAGDLHTFWERLATRMPGHPGGDPAAAIVKAGWRAQSVVQRLLEFLRPPSGNMATRSRPAALPRGERFSGSKNRFSWDIQVNSR